MKKILLIIFLFIGVSGVLVFAQEKHNVVSTQGIENLDENVAKSKPSIEDKYDLKAKIKERKHYFKIKRAITKQDKLRTKQLNEIEYLEKRLEEKKQRLEVFNSTDKKGENEE